MQPAARVTTSSQRFGLEIGEKFVPLRCIFTSQFVHLAVEVSL